MKFNPDRQFTEDELWCEFSGLNTESNRFSPFSFNPRSCLGKSFAHIEMRLILLTLIKHFKFTLSPNQKIDKSNIEFNRGTMGFRNLDSTKHNHKLLVNISERISKL